MSIRKVSFALGEFYHLYNRGNSKQRIFHDAQDYLTFMTLLYLCNQTMQVRLGSRYGDPFGKRDSEPLVAIGSYVLMPNHFHILATEKTEGGISKFMQKVSTGYVMYYNQKYKRTGSLFEGKFKSQYLSTDKYLKYIFSYIHLNPIKLIQKDWKDTGIKDKTKALEYLKNYQYSSYAEFVGIDRTFKCIIDKSAFPEYFPSSKQFNKEILEWLSYNDSAEVLPR